MTTPNNDDFDFCPRCGSPFDTRLEAVVICPDCLIEGSTGCCCQNGARALCDACEQAAGEVESRPAAKPIFASA